ncbi:MAG: type II toxin-antitoxin system prevent-host-death family antitoxin [Candidatus Sulfotelmatobacter sp.]
MRSVSAAELKNRLSKYLAFAKGGEEIVIRDRNLPVAKLVPFSVTRIAKKNYYSSPLARCV